MKIINKYLIAISIIATIAISGVGLYAHQLALLPVEQLGNGVSILPIAAQSNINIPVKMDSMNAGGNNYIQIDSILNKYGFTNDTNQKIMKGIADELTKEKYDLEYVDLSKDDQGRNFLVVRSNKPQHLNFTEEIAFTVDGTKRTDYFLQFDCVFTPIETQITLNSSTPNEINENTMIDGKIKAVNYYDKDNYVRSANYNGSLSVGVQAIDNPNQFLHIYDITTVNGSFQFKSFDDLDIGNGRPGNYSILFNANSESYSNITNSVQGEQLDAYKITHVRREVAGGVGALDSSKPKWIYTAVQNAGNAGFLEAETNTGTSFQVTDYWGTPVKDLNVIVSGENIISDIDNIKTNGDGAFTISRAIKFSDADVKHDINLKVIIPANEGKNRYSDLELIQTVKRVSKGTEKIWIKSAGSGTVFNSNTYTAPNGISITAKGGIVGFVGIAKAQFYDHNGMMIYEEQHRMATAEEKSISVPKGACTVVYTLDIDEDGKKAKIITDQVPVGDAAIFFEGAIGTENCHIAARNLNGFEFLREDK